MATVLMYNLSPEKEIKLKNLCREMFLEAVTVEKADYGRTLGAVLGLSEDGEIRTAEDFADEMLYLHDLRGGMLDLFLNRVRKKKLGVALKAVSTPTNLTFTSAELHRELCAEREAIMQGMKAHEG